MQILEERKKVYGDYNRGVKGRAEMMRILQDKHLETHGRPMPTELQIMLGDVLLKLIRIAASPEHLDSFIDLAGYSKLMSDYMASKGAINDND